MEKEIEKGTFREDLYFRLNVIPMRVPSLRERVEDIPSLVKEFVSEFALSAKVEPKAFPPETLELLQKYDWPGNVRELKNLIERLMIMTQSDVITPKDIPAPFNQTTKSVRVGVEPAFSSDSLKEAKGEFEKAFIEEKLNEYNGNISQTAEAIGIERSNLHKKIKQYNLGR